MKALDGISRNKAKAILAGGGVTVNGKNRSQHDFPLNPGDRVEISKRKSGPTLQNKHVRLVYEDAYIIVIEKGVGILSMASSHHAYSVKTVIDDYLRKSHQGVTAHVVHRLDRDTSGLMMLAKSVEAKDALQHNWNNMVLSRKYVAVLEGELESDEGVVKSYLAENSKFEVYSTNNPNEGQLAITNYKVIRRGRGMTLVEVELDTGRKNQIRVHMKDLGHPIVGDRKYGAKPSPIHRLALHAQTLRFVHPITRKDMKFETPIPAKFRGLVM